MVVVHELAHLREYEHNKAFYQLCLHMEPDYPQLEFDLRVYLGHLDATGRGLWVHIQPMDCVALACERLLGARRSEWSFPSQASQRPEGSPLGGRRRRRMPGQPGGQGTGGEHRGVAYRLRR
jgi:hypothetical protein